MRQNAICESCKEQQPPSYEELFPNARTSMTENKESTIKEIGSQEVKDEPSLELVKRPNRTYFSKTKMWPEGEGVYYGELDWKGRRVGHGKMVWGGGARVYLGYWAKNRMEGEGIIFWASTGTFYKGQWKKGLVHGLGRLVYGPRSDTPGDTFEGEFRLDTFGRHINT